MPKWTEEMEEYLRANYMNMSDARIAVAIEKNFGVPMKTIHIADKRCRLRLLRKQVVTRTGKKIARPTLTTIKVHDKKYRFSVSEVNNIFILCMLDKPYYVVYGNTFRAARRMFLRVMGARKQDDPTKFGKEWTPEKVKQARREYTVTDISITMLANKYQCNRSYLTKILRNQVWRDKNYVPPTKGTSARARAILVVVYDHEPARSLSAWSKDPRCKVSYTVIRRRYTAGVTGEALIS